jgi:hypothetical protein
MPSRRVHHVSKHPEFCCCWSRWCDDAISRSCGGRTTCFSLIVRHVPAYAHECVFRTCDFVNNSTTFQLRHPRHPRRGYCVPTAGGRGGRTPQQSHVTHSSIITHCSTDFSNTSEHRVVKLTERPRAGGQNSTPQRYSNSHSGAPTGNS